MEYNIENKENKHAKNLLYTSGETMFKINEWIPFGLSNIELLAQKLDAHLYIDNKQENTSRKPG
jgi:hypothetical protein